MATCTGSTTDIDGIRYTLSDLARSSGVFTATIGYEFDGLYAEQRFSVLDVGDDRLAELAGTARLRLDSSLNPSGTPVLLRPSDTSEPSAPSQT